MLCINSPVKNKKIINKKTIKLGTATALAALLVACSDAVEQNLVVMGDVTDGVSAGDDVVTLGAQGGGGMVDLGAGNDTVTGGAQADFIRGGAGADNINGGAGVDNFVVIGVTNNADYTLDDLQNPNNTGIDLSSLVELGDLNNNNISDAVAGEVIDGGADGAILFVYGIVDFTGITLINITRIDVHSEVYIPASSLNTLINDGIFNALYGDGTTSLIITNTGSAIEVDFSTIDMQGVNSLTLEAGVTLVIDQADLSGTTIINGNGSIKAVSGLLDLDGLQIEQTVTILDSAGNIITPTFGGASAVSIDENTTSIGVFSVTDASAVGDVTYTITGNDAALFNINAATGELSFKTSPDFENMSDSDVNNIYDVTITATDERGASTSQNITVTV